MWSRQGLVALALVSGVTGDWQPTSGPVAGLVRFGTRPADGIVVYLRGEGEPTGRPGEDLMIDQRQLRFEPGTLVITPGTRVEFLNSDPILHNVFSPSRPEPFDLGRYPQSESRSHTFMTEGVHVMLCHVHPEMIAYIVVVGSTHWATSDAAGRFEIDAIVPGQYEMVVWAPRSGIRFSRMLVVPTGGVSGIEIDVGRRTVRTGRDQGSN